LKAARAAASAAKVWVNAYFGAGGAPFRADVLVGSPPNSAYDFKFNCKPKAGIGLAQRLNYKKYTGLTPEPIHVDGSTC